MDDEDYVDLVSKAEQEFFECIEAEKNRRQRDKDRELITDDDEKHDRGKVRLVSPVDLPLLTLTVSVLLLLSTFSH